MAFGDFVQAKSQGAPGSSIAFNGNVVLGNDLYVACLKYQAVPNTPTDSLGNTYVEVTHIHGANYYLYLFKAPVTTGGACTVSIDASLVAVNLQEQEGPSGTVEATNAGTGGSSGVNSGNAFSTVGGYAIGAIFDLSGVAPASPWVVGSGAAQSDSGYTALTYRPTSPATNYAVTNADGGSEWSALVATIKASGGGPSTPRLLTLLGVGT